MKNLLISSAALILTANIANAQVAFSHAEVTVEYVDTSSAFASVSSTRTSYQGRAAFSFGNYIAQFDAAITDSDIASGDLISTRFTFHTGYQISDAFSVAVYGGAGQNTLNNGTPDDTAELGLEASFDMDRYSFQAAFGRATNRAASGTLLSERDSYRFAAAYDVTDAFEVYTRFRHIDIIGSVNTIQVYDVGASYSFDNSPFKIDAFYGKIERSANPTSERFGIALTYELGPNAGNGFWDLF